MSGGSFFDTNILLYLYNEANPGKQATARALFQEHANLGDLVLSTQVVQEFYSVGRRKLGLPRPALARAVRLLLALPMVEVTGQEILSAILMEERYGISFWDALIVAAASSCGAKVLYTEDLNDGQEYGGVVVRNPFVA